MFGERTLPEVADMESFMEPMLQNLTMLNTPGTLASTNVKLQSRRTTPESGLGGGRFSTGFASRGRKGSFVSPFDRGLPGSIFASPYTPISCSKTPLRSTAANESGLGLLAPGYSLRERKLALGVSPTDSGFYEGANGVAGRSPVSPLHGLSGNFASALNTSPEGDLSSARIPHPGTGTYPEKHSLFGPKPSCLPHPHPFTAPIPDSVPTVDALYHPDGTLLTPSFPAWLPVDPDIALDCAFYWDDFTIGPQGANSAYTPEECKAILRQFLSAATKPVLPSYPDIEVEDLIPLALDIHLGYLAYGVFPGVPASPIAPARSYAAYFNPDGSPRTPLMLNDFGKPVLPHSRGIFIRGLPWGCTLCDITNHIRGGALERVDWHPRLNRPFVGAYFLIAEDAAHFIRSVRGKRFWGDVTVEAITHAKGGHEVMKPNVAKAVAEEGATRCLVVQGLSEEWNLKRVEEAVKAQSKTVEVVCEAVLWTGGGDVMLVMASVGTALGARLVLRGMEGGENLKFRFTRDKCEGVVEELGCGVVGRE